MENNSLPNQINLRQYDIRGKVHCPQAYYYGHSDINPVYCFKCESNTGHTQFDGIVCTHPDTKEVKGRKLELRVNDLGEHWYE